MTLASPAAASAAATSTAVTSTAPTSTAPTSTLLTTVPVRQRAAGSSHDPRAERTRQLIFAAIRTLMSERTSGVSVGEIVQSAGISRSSFYAHFSSLDELASELLSDQFAGIDQLAGTDSAGIRSARLDKHHDGLVNGRSAARAGYARLIEHMLENFPLYSSVLDLPLTRSVYDRIVAAYATQILESMLVKGAVPTGVSAELATTYIAGGAMTLISAWMRGRFEASDDEVVDQLVRMLPNWLADP